MVSSCILFLLFAGSISAAPVAQDDWTDIVKAGADVVGKAAKVAIDVAKIIADAGRKREVQDGWQDIVSAGADVLGNTAKVAVDIVKIIADIKGKREVQDGLGDLVAAVEAEVAKIVAGALKVVETVQSSQVSQREVQDANWGSLIVDGAAAVNDIIDLGKSIGHLVTVVGK